MALANMQHIDWHSLITQPFVVKLTVSGSWGICIKKMKGLIRSERSAG